jgi:glycerophosphoryl diester phosphodiesterase
LAFGEITVTNSKPGKVRRFLIAAVIGALLLTTGVVTATTAGPALPRQFYRPLTLAPSVETPATTVVAHNAGNDPFTTMNAIQYGADVIEIDVLIDDGQLRAAHNLPATTTGRLGWKVAPPPLLPSATDAARSAAAIQLDLKTTDPELLPLLLDFFADHISDAHWIVSSPDLVILTGITSEHPDIEPILSIGTANAMSAAMADPHALSFLTGVSVRASLLDDATVTYFQSLGLRVLAWTVDDAAGLGRMLDLGVDAVVTNNLAIVYALSGGIGEPGVAWLRARV